MSCFEEIKKDLCFFYYRPIIFPIFLVWLVWIFANLICPSDKRELFPAIGYIPPYHRRWRKKEEKAKVVAAVWGTESIQFIAAQDIFHQDDCEEKE